MAEDSIWGILNWDLSVPSLKAAIQTIRAPLFFAVIFLSLGFAIDAGPVIAAGTACSLIAIYKLVAVLVGEKHRF